MELPENPIVIGCNYHTKWQKEKGMRFVLVAVLTNGRCMLQTRTTNRQFSTNVSDLIFIQTKHNREKAIRLLEQKKKKYGNT